MQIYLVIFFTNHPIHPWGLLSSILLYCPCQTHLLQPLSLNASLLHTLVTIGAVFKKVGVQTSSTTEGTDLQCPDQTFAASTTPPPVMENKATGRENGSTVGGKIHAANCAKHSSILLLTALSFSTKAMDSNLVQI